MHPPHHRGWSVPAIHPAPPTVPNLCRPPPREVTADADSGGSVTLLASLTCEFLPRLAPPIFLDADPQVTKKSHHAAPLGSAVNYVHYSAKRTDMEPRDAGQQDLHHGTRGRLTPIQQVPPHGMPSSSSRSRRPNPDPSEPRDIQTIV